jgi:hypothetical protein
MINNAKQFLYPGLKLQLTVPIGIHTLPGKEWFVLTDKSLLIISLIEQKLLANRL